MSGLNANASNVESVGIYLYPNKAPRRIDAGDARST